MGHIDHIIRAAARRVLFGTRKPSHREAVRAKAAQLRAEIATARLQQVRAALAVERAYPAVAEAIGQGER